MIFCSRVRGVISDIFRNKWNGACKAPVETQTPCHYPVPVLGHPNSLFLPHAFIWPSALPLFPSHYGGMHARDTLMRESVQQQQRHHLKRWWMWASEKERESERDKEAKSPYPAAIIYLSALVTTRVYEELFTVRREEKVFGIKGIKHFGTCRCWKIINFRVKGSLFHHTNLSLIHFL